jgi:hypothetical protein
MKKVWCLMAESRCWECGVSELISICSTKEQAHTQLEILEQGCKVTNFYIDEREVND